jgi:hypothetical protein
MAAEARRVEKAVLQVQEFGGGGFGYDTRRGKSPHPTFESCRGGARRVM